MDLFKALWCPYYKRFCNKGQLTLALQLLKVFSPGDIFLITHSKSDVIKLRKDIRFVILEIIMLFFIFKVAERNVTCVDSTGMVVNSDSILT